MNRGDFSFSLSEDFMSFAFIVIRDNESPLATRKIWFGRLEKASFLIMVIEFSMLASSKQTSFSDELITLSGPAP